MNKILDILIPRFITEEVAFEYDEDLDAYAPAFSIADLGPGEIPQQVGTIRSFNFFGCALFPKLVGELHDYKP